MSMSVAVIGSGYVGLTVGACLADLGHRVVCVDIDADKIERLRRGRVEILEAGLDGLVVSGMESGHLSFSDDAATAVGAASVILLCLPTPTRPDGDLDLRFLEAAVTSLATALQPGAVVVTKSTVPVGTHRRVAAWLARSDVSVVSNPEFLREGSAVADFYHPDRVVIGADDRLAATIVASLYARLDAPVQITDATSAELIKYAANAFLATKLSFINEMSRVCEAVGADIDEVSTGLGTDRRIGGSFLQSGPGWGGSCFPKDTRGLAHLAVEHGLELPVASAVIGSNVRQFEYVVARIAALVPGPLAGARVGVWGLAFKADTDDCRDSPAFEISTRLVAGGAEVVAFDPAAACTPAGVERVNDPYSACRDADVLVVLTEWAEFGCADMEKVWSLMRHPVVYDTRAVVEPHHARSAGIELSRLGCPR